MALDVPQSGWSLCRDHPGNDPKAPTHAMRLNLPQNTMDDLIQSLRDNKPARIRFGKHQALYYGSKSQSFHSSPESHRSEIYSAGPTDSQNIYFSGTLSHRLEVQKAQEATAATDQALANLEQSLNAYEQGKESKRTHMIHDINEVKGLRTKPSKFPPANKKHLLKPSSSSTNRSVSTTPLGGITRSPAAGLTPTSAPVTQSKDQRRLDALKLPFIHLLAVRAVSVKFLARQTRASIDDCTALAQKFGVENRINREKFDLKDKTYRELDVWSFPYPSQEDRDEAIENAISAFDRLRISRSDKQWQSLLPREERGKGKCLSRLDLRTGPFKKNAGTASRVLPEDGSGKDGYSTGHETDKDTAEASSAKPEAQKKRVADKDGAPAKRAPVKGKTTANSTLTGRVTKKAGKPATAKPDGKIKSAEYVHDSDEDDDLDMPDAPAPASAPPVEKKVAAATTTSTSTESKKKPHSAQPAQSKPAPKQRVVGSNGPGSAHPTSKLDKSERAPAKREPQSSAAATKSTTAAKKLPTGSGNGGSGGSGAAAAAAGGSGRATNSTSPQKPSPLGSSPPANASEIRPSHSRSSSQNYASSSSSSPLITQISRPKQRPDASATGVTKTAARTNNNNFVKREASNPLKRKAEAERLAVPPPTVTARTGSLEHKRRRAVSPSSGGSTGSASPPLSYELLRQQLREKSQKFKHNYAKYRQLHDSLANHPNPPRAELDRLHRQHKQLQMIKKEIWDEDRRLREGL